MAKLDNLHKFLTKWIVPLASGVVVLGALFAGVRYIALTEVTSQVATIKSDVSTLQTGLGGLRDDAGGLRTDIGKANDRIDGVLTKALERAFPIPTAGKKTLSGSLKQADELLQIAKAENIKLNPALFAAYGKNLASLTNELPLSATAWQTLTTMTDYRSFLNADFVPSLGQLTPATGKSNYRSAVTIIPNPQHPEWHIPFGVFFAGGYAAADKSARLESLSKPQPEGSEFAFFVVEGGMDTILLDGAYMRNVIIRHSDVAYNGGPVVLENVYFVNCTFKQHFQMTPSGRDLGAKLLAAAAVTFESRKPTSAGL